MTESSIKRVINPFSSTSIFKIITEKMNSPDIFTKLISDSNYNLTLCLAPKSQVISMVCLRQVLAALLINK